MDFNEMDQEWKGEAPRLAAMEKINPYTVPADYFPSMELEVMSRVHISQMALEETLDLPENYFNSLEEQITSRIALESLKLPSEKLFQVPEQYFESLDQRLSNIVYKQETKSTSIVRKFTTSWVTYAAAACIMAMIATGLYLNKAPEPIETEIAQLPDDEIIDYLKTYSEVGDVAPLTSTQENIPEISDLIPELSETEIEKYLESTL